ncbi:MAG: TonB-dependent receptor [Verrucomicrobiaceae bacterium]|nr:TonB-dependent receptor [Verrucomicrobiaceae bacterium]
MYLQKLRGRAFALFFTLGSLPAAEPHKAVELTERVVTATKTETERWRTASSVTVIDRKKIEQDQLQLLPDALRQVPGLNIADRGTTGMVAGVFLRGTNSDQTLVVLDGRPIPANLAGLYNIETMALDNVERIEVLRGPAASIYGGRTLGGVINIITRGGKGLKKPEFGAFFEAGSFGTFREGASTRGEAGIMDWSLEYSRLDSDGYRINSQVQMDNTSGRLGFQLADTLRLDIDFRYYNADLGVPGDITTHAPANPFFPSDNSDDHLLTEFWSVSPRLVWETTPWWTQSLTYQFGSFRQVATDFTPGYGLNNRITSRTHFWEYQSVFRPVDRWTITAGAWVQDNGYSRYNNDGLFEPVFGFFTNPGANSYDVDQAETNWALFLQSQAEILPGWNVIGGVRHDSYSDFEDATTWRAGTSWRLPWTQTVLHANYGTAFAPASPQNREAALFGNPLFVRPERSRGFEIGIEQPFAKNTASIGLTWFRNSIRNFIEFDPFVPPFGALQQIDRVRTEGLEALFNWSPSDRFGLSVNYTYLEADNVSDLRRLVRRPRHSFSSDVWARPCERLRIGLGALYAIDREDGFGAAQRDVEDYLRLRLTASLALTKNVELFARVENLLGERYSEVLNFPSMRTGAYAGFRLRF